MCTPNWMAVCNPSRVHLFELKKIIEFRDLFMMIRLQGEVNGIFLFLPWREFEMISAGEVSDCCHWRVFF